MRPIAYSQIRNYSNEFTNPSRAYWLMKDFMNTAIKLAKDTVTKDMMLKFSNAKTAFNEEEEIANRLVLKMKSKSQSLNAKYEITKHLMRIKKNDAIKCVSESKSKLEKSKRNLNPVVRKGTLVRDMFMETVDGEVKVIWENGKQKSDQKLKFTIQKRGTSKEIKNEPIFEGVIVGDKELEDLESKLKETVKNDEQPRVYSDIKLNKEQKDILLLPPNFQAYPKLSLEKFDTEIEKCMVKATWESNRKSIKKERALAEKENEDNDHSKVEKGNDKVYDRTTKTLDLRNLKATDLKNNKRVILHKNNDDEKEVKRNNVVSEFRRIFTNYRNKHCDRFGNLKDNNLNEKQRTTIKDLKKKMIEEKLVCFKTDKTGFLALDTQENLAKKMTKHIEKDKEIDEKAVKTIENKLNKKTEHFLNITSAGENTKQVSRIKGNLKTVDNQIPILSATSKDHKELKKEETSPDVRAIMGAMVGPNVGIATIAGMVIKTITEEADVGLVSKSTEETVNKIEGYNDKREAENKENHEIVVGSMDIEKWYQRTIPKPSAKVVRKMAEESKVIFAGVRYDKVSRFLGEELTLDEIKTEGFEEIVYIRKKTERKSKKKAEPKPQHDESRKNETDDNTIPSVKNARIVAKEREHYDKTPKSIDGTDDVAKENNEQVETKSKNKVSQSINDTGNVAKATKKNESVESKTNDKASNSIDDTANVAQETKKNESVENKTYNKASKSSIDTTIVAKETENNEPVENL